LEMPNFAWINAVQDWQKKSADQLGALTWQLHPLWD